MKSAHSNPPVWVLGEGGVSPHPSRLYGSWKDGGGGVPDPCGAHPQPPLPAAGIFSRRPKKPARGGAAEKEAGAEEPCTFLICDDNDINCQVSAAGVGGEGGGGRFAGIPKFMTRIHTTYSPPLSART